MCVVASALDYAHGSVGVAAVTGVREQAEPPNAEAGARIELGVVGAQRIVRTARHSGLSNRAPTGARIGVEDEICPG